MTETPWHEDIVLPVLLAAGRATYGFAIRRSLADAGFDDMPRTGARIVGGIRRNASNLTLSDVAESNGTSKQAASQLVDTLVTRGYVVRVPDEDDRRRQTIGLTERGEAAAVEINKAVTRVDEAFEAAVGADAIAQMRATVAALIELRRNDRDGD